MKNAVPNIGALLVATVFLIVLDSCAFNPATGEHQLVLVGEQQEIAMGMEADKQIPAAMGLYPDENLQAYVDGVGQRLAASSERPDLPWKFRVVDDPVVNAFALPGGFIYLTRGILAHFSSEAEMASVLGHEIGHVTGRHSVEQMSRQQLAGIGLGMAMVMSPELRPYGGMAQAGLGLMFLKYGRDDERQADDLGLRYMLREGYDPSQMPRVFDTLAAVSRAQGGGGRIPPWLSTHPAPQERAQRVRAVLAQAEAQGAERRVLRDAYLSRIDGIVFGADPRQGYVRDGTFVHPELAFGVDFPPGWQLLNQRAQAVAVSPQQDAILVLSLARAADASSALRGFLNQQGLRAERAQAGEINGLRAVSAPFQATSQQGSVAGVGLFIEYDSRVYQLLGYTGAQSWSAYRPVFEAAMRSFHAVRDRALLDVEASRIDIVELPRAMTLREFASRYRGTADLQTLTLINQIDPDRRIDAGTRIKRVVGGVSTGER